jgi:hypothetical protein
MLRDINADLKKNKNKNHETDTVPYQGYTKEKSERVGRGIGAGH